MDDKTLNEKESITLITQMINNAKGRFSENGHLYLLWGWTVLVCSIAQFVLMKYVKIEQHYFVWFATWLVLIYQVIYLRRQKKKEKVKDYAHDIIGMVWMAFVVLMFLMGFICVRMLQDNAYELIGPAFLSLYGMPTVLSGTILRFRPLVIGGVCCWILALISTFIPAEYRMLLLPVAVIAAWIIPGYLLRSRHQKTL
jgi:hypothetical protein